MTSSSETPKECDVAEEESWQFNKSVAQCNFHMLEHGIATDVTFLVSCDSGDNSDSEAQTFSAHKYMLISRSPVFYAMLCGDLAERGEIRVTDVEPEAFRQMLYFIYTDCPQLNLDFVANVIYASKKYLLPGLTTKCASFIKAHLNTENVCSILDQILIFEENKLNNFCLNLIMKETNKVLETETFLAISHAALSKILDIKSCKVNEIDVFKYCLKWARQKCTADKKEATGINMRQALGDCVTKFRFSEVGDFAREICPTGVLTKDQENGILRHWIDRQAIPVPTGFNCTARCIPIYRIHTTDKIQQVEWANLDFKISIDSSNPIQVNEIWIGKAPSYALSNFSIKYNDEDVSVVVSNSQDKRKLVLKCKSEFVIKRGFSTLQLTYKTRGNYGFTVGNGLIYGVPRSEITFKDSDRIALKVSTSNRFIPLLGLAYQTVLK